MNLFSQNLFQERVVSRREAEFNRLEMEREERTNQIIQLRKQEREAKRKFIYYLRCEEERQIRLREEEEARKREEMERRKKEEAERKAKLDEIAEKQRQRERELEEKERQRREELLGRSNAMPSRLTDPSAMSRQVEAPPAATAPAAAPTPGVYVPRFKRMAAEGAPPAENDRWASGSVNRRDDRTSQAGDRWRDEHRTTSFGGPPKATSTWSSSRGHDR
ncbi:eukaryotic translation initiation factor 3 subunit A-like [Olea europaea var. sylvestris]|uniref:eukaryotic translation initiation factor 3 subunit A-like n=1 Tax=Olea europaea var. sylvestris TaxID=158386 RepID=UPI000C1CCCB4|nr:eukaryotic translation initiation factor 3 subunit A-like [Olea europaea var. sylvestris]